jgi:hypothetical protein
LLFKANTPFSNIQFVLFNRFSANTWKLFRVKFVSGSIFLSLHCAVFDRINLADQNPRSIF